MPPVVLDGAHSPSCFPLWLSQLISSFGDTLHYMALVVLVIIVARQPEIGKDARFVEFFVGLTILALTGVVINAKVADRRNDPETREL